MSTDVGVIAYHELASVVIWLVYGLFFVVPCLLARRGMWRGTAALFVAGGVATFVVFYEPERRVGDASGVMLVAFVLPYLIAVGIGALARRLSAPQAAA